MRFALKPPQGRGAEPDDDSIHWAALPGLCCVASGGEANWADELAAAWYLLYCAADMMDSIEDEEELDSWWAESGPKGGINISSGLFFSAALALNELHRKTFLGSNPSDVVENFYHGFLQVCGGQQEDLAVAQPTLEQYWRIAESKSGAFFSLATKCGAQLATTDAEKLEGFRRYGSAVGILIQVRDDLEELRSLQRGSLPEKKSSLVHSLPLIYALEVLGDGEKSALLAYLAGNILDPQPGLRVFEILERSGVVIYILTQLEKYKAKALAGLASGEARKPARENLVAIIENLSQPT